MAIECLLAMKSPQPETEESGAETLADRLRRQEAEILSLWELRVRQRVPASRALDRLSLRNSIPLVLERLAVSLENLDSLEEPKIEVARKHGQERATLPQYSINEVILEYRLLGRTIFDVITPGPLLDRRARGVITDVIEVGISEAVAAFANYQYRLREQFITSLAHDLRTPLSSASSCAQLILRQPENVEATQKLSARIVDAIARTDRMIEDLLDSNLVRNGGVLPLKINKHDLRVIIKTTLEEAASAVGNRFVYEPGETPLWGYWDIRYIKRALENVAINGIKYGDAYSPVRVSTEVHAQEVTIAIHNKGAPIAAADLETIFDPFQRIERAKKLGKVGWGIGLSLVKGVMDAHGGRIIIETHEKTGTTFKLILPLDTRTQTIKAA